MKKHEEIDLVELRRRLPKGAITEIANKLNISPQRCSNIFLYGDLRQYHMKAAELALAILDGMEPDEELLEKAKKYGATTSFPRFHKRKRYLSKSKRDEELLAEIEEADRDELEATAIDFEIDPGDYDNDEDGDDELRDAIEKEAGLIEEEPEEEEEEEEEEKID